jgi:hypothetical protein
LTAAPSEKAKVDPYPSFLVNGIQRLGKLSWPDLSGSVQLALFVFSAAFFSHNKFV